MHQGKTQVGREMCLSPLRWVRWMCKGRHWQALGGDSQETDLWMLRTGNCVKTIQSLYVLEKFSYPRSMDTQFEVGCFKPFLEKYMWCKDSRYKTACQWWDTQKLSRIKDLLYLYFLLSEQLTFQSYFDTEYNHIFKNWRILALQCCVGFCYTTTWLSFKYTYILSLLSLPPSPPIHPLRSYFDIEYLRDEKSYTVWNNKARIVVSK